MSQLITVLSTTITVGKHEIVVSITVDPDVQSLPVMLLTWDADGINNQEEFYIDVPTAFARLAAIVMCCEDDWDAALRDGPFDFTQRAHIFLTDSIGW